VKTFAEAVPESFELVDDDYFSFRFGDANQYELTLEPLIGGLFAVALYQDGDLMLKDKIPVRPGPERRPVPSLTGGAK
jgi:hypothetical protein